MPPEVARERGRVRLHGPGAVGDSLVTPHPAEKHAHVPVEHAVAEEQEMTSSELRRERHGHCARRLDVREVVDVVVLADDEALPLASRRPVDATVNLEDDGTEIGPD